MKPGKPKPDIEAVCTEIKMGTVKPVYVVGGPEDYLVFHTRKRLTNALLERFDAADVSVHDWNDVSIEDLIHQLNTPMLFEPFRVIVIRDVPFFSGGKDAAFPMLEAWLKSVSDRSTGFPAALICTSSKIDGRLTSVKTVQKYGPVLDFQPPQTFERGDPKRDGYFGIMMHHLKSSGKSMSAESWASLRQRIPNNLWAVATSLENLIIYSGSRKTITTDDIEELIAPGDELPVFAVTEAIGEKDFFKVSEQIAHILNAGTPALLLNKLMSARIRLMIMTKSLMDSKRPAGWRGDMEYFRFKEDVYPAILSSIEQDPGLLNLIGKLHPFAFFSIVKQSTKFQMEQLRDCLHSLAAVDLALKSTSKPPFELLTGALMPMCRDWK